MLANPLVKQTLRVDPSTWQTNAALSPEVRAKVDATLARQRALKASRAGQEVKVGSLLRAYQRAAAAADPAPAGRVRTMRSRLPILGVEPDGSVRARIHLRGGPDAEAAIRALGVRIARVSDDRRMLYAALSAAEIDRVAAQAVVARISPIVGAKVNAGSVLSEGVAALRADRVQDAAPHHRQEDPHRRHLGRHRRASPRRPRPATSRRPRPACRRSSCAR